MKITRIIAVFYSATGNTEKAALGLAGRMSKQLGASMESYDFTRPDSRAAIHTYAPSELVIFGTPVYAGRVPNKMLPYIQGHFRGEGALAIPIVTFGNRSFDDGLTELGNELERSGFHSVGAAALACSHVFSDKIAPGRPDGADWERLGCFAEMAAEKITHLVSMPAPIEVKGRNPVGPYYTPLGEDGKPAVFLKAKPRTYEEICDHCGVCAQACPMGAISEEDPASVPGICIKCHACVLKCHAQAKYFDDPAFLSHVRMLERDFTRRAEPEFFL